MESSEETDCLVSSEHSSSSTVYLGNHPTLEDQNNLPSESGSEQVQLKLQKFFESENIGVPELPDNDSDKSSIVSMNKIIYPSKTAKLTKSPRMSKFKSNKVKKPSPTISKPNSALSHKVSVKKRSTSNKSKILESEKLSKTSFKLNHDNDSVKIQKSTKPSSLESSSVNSNQTSKSPKVNKPDSKFKSSKKVPLKTSSKVISVTEDNVSSNKNKSKYRKPELLNFEEQSKDDEISLHNPEDSHIKVKFSIEKQEIEKATASPKFTHSEPVSLHKDPVSSTMSKKPPVLCSMPEREPVPSSISEKGPVPCAIPERNSNTPDTPDGEEYVKFFANAEGNISGEKDSEHINNKHVNESSHTLTRKIKIEEPDLDENILSRTSFLPSKIYYEDSLDKSTQSKNFSQCDENDDKDKLAKLLSEFTRDIKNNPLSDERFSADEISHERHQIFLSKSSELRYDPHKINPKNDGFIKYNAIVKTEPLDSDIRNSSCNSIDKVSSRENPNITSKVYPQSTELSINDKGNQVVATVPVLPANEKNMYENKMKYLGNDQITETQFRMASKNDELEQEVMFIKMIQTLVHLNPDWLNVKEAATRPPSEVKGKDLPHLPLKFNNYNFYASAFFHVLLLEIWNDMCSHFQDVFKNVQRTIITFCVKHYSYKTGFMEMKCESSFKSGDEGFIPKKGDLIVMELVIDNVIKKTFGYTVQHSVKIMEGFSDRKICQFVVYTKSRKTVPRGSEFNSYVICNIQKNVELCRALDLIQNSQLLKDILSPRLETFSLNTALQNNKLTSSNCINIFCSELKASSERPQIILLQGPPGSGKTKIIVNSLYDLNRRRSNVNILVTAPTAVALDVIQDGLIDMIETTSWFDNVIDFVRFSKEHSSDEYSIYQRSLCEQRLSSQNENTGDTWESCSSYYYIKVLKKCNIVLSTLSDCYELMKYKDELNFSWVIIDEVNQSTELQAILPLVLGVRKVLLVGDTKLFKPTVKSKLAKECGYERSIFERFLSYFKQNGQNPAITLYEQFRMHADISVFPSRYFYKEKENWQVVSNHTFFLKPYLVFDKVTNTQSDYSDLLSDYSDIAEMCKEMRQFCPFMHISVIVPDYRDINSCKTALRNKYVEDIEVNVITAYQGREIEIVIVSCFSQNEEGCSYLTSLHSLNVALTRAFHTLILCGHFSDFKYDMWNRIVQDAKHRRFYIPYNNDLSSKFLNNIVKTDTLS